LKRFYRKGEQVTLKPANPKYRSHRGNGSKRAGTRCLVGVWRGCDLWVDTAGVIELQAMTSKASNPKGKIRFIELTELVLET
jgi:hypothetical protein